MPTDDILKQLQSQAGPRGYTYAGRALPQGNQSLGDIMAQSPTAELESAGTALDPTLLKSFGDILTAGIPLLSKMRLPEGYDFNKTLDAMYKESAEKYSKNNPSYNMTKDQFIEGLMSRLGLSSLRSMRGPEKVRPDLTKVGVVVSNKDSAIPRIEQLATAVNTAERLGAIDNPKILENLMQSIYKRSYMTLSDKPSKLDPKTLQTPHYDIQPELLDWYREFLEGVKPEKK